MESAPYQAVTDEWSARMSQSEFQVYTSFLRKTRVLIEFGCGGSTMLALKLGVPHIFSTESDPEWAEKLRTSSELTSLPEECRPAIRYCDIGPVGEWGAPVDESGRERWPRYHADVWNDVASNKVDCVLVDGRFRVACVLQALLRIRADVPVIVHDFWNREHYHAVLPFLAGVSRVDTMMIGRRLPEARREDITACLDTYEFDYR